MRSSFPDFKESLPHLKFSGKAGFGVLISCFPDSKIFQACGKLFCEVIQRSPDRDFFGITTAGRYLDFVLALFSAAGSQGNFRVFQIFRGKSVSEENLFGERHLVRLDRDHQLVAIVFVVVNTRLRFAGFFLQRRCVSSSRLPRRCDRASHEHE
jgi:hypothetical protein